MKITSRRYTLALFSALLFAAAPAFADSKPACQNLQLARIPLHYTGLSLGITMDGTINGTPTAAGRDGEHAGMRACQAKLYIAEREAALACDPEKP